MRLDGHSASRQLWSFFLEAVTQYPPPEQCRCCSRTVSDVLMKNELYQMATDAPVNTNNASKPNPGLDGEHASRFRVIAYVVHAVRRFKRSLNPTITFGKRTSEDGSSRTLTDGVSLRQSSSSLRTLTGSLKKTGSRRVTSYLFQPLPEVEST